MKVKELVNSCQNQWCGLFKVNPLFKIHFTFEECENTESFTIKEFNNYELDGVSNNYIFDLINKRHNQEVISWSMVGLNDINILVKEF